MPLATDSASYVSGTAPPREEGHIAMRRASAAARLHSFHLHSAEEDEGITPRYIIVFFSCAR